jgi:RNA polymerase sigma-54 factor
MIWEQGGYIMNLHYGIHQIRTQKLVMTPELRTAITLLQFSSLELTDYLYQQANENPLIEIREAENTNGEVTEQGSKQHDGVGGIDWQGYVRDHFSNRVHSSYMNREAENTIERISGYQPLTLEQHLLDQLCYIDNVDTVIKKIASFIIGNLNEQGYLEISALEAAQILGIPVARVESALKLVQSLDPAGVGARNLCECLKIQLDRSGEIDPLVYHIVQNHIEDLAYNRYQKVATYLQVSGEKVKACFKKIKFLDPKPGSRFYHEPPHFITSDIKVEQFKGEYVVILNDQVIPRLSINRYYEQMLNSRQEKSEVNQFIYDKLNAAMWLIRSLEQRNNTLYKVMESIVQKQRDFFEYGVSHLRPLTLKQIAEVVHVHESTVSRVTNNKYVQTPRGLFELKFFFTSGVSNGEEDQVSSQCVKMKIKGLIEGEDKTQPLSDQEIAQKLNVEGIMISRRTIAKYREEIRIPSSSKRRSAG